MSNRISPEVITVHKPRSPVAEAYRTLRTSLEFSSLDKPLRTMVVTSPGPGEGKSTVLANLGVVLAQADKKVILADCDLRRPSLHELFGLQNGRGITTMMVEEEALQNPPLLETGVQNLWLLPSGPLPPNPAELMASRRMGEIIERLAQESDIVLFDAPPAVAVTDAIVLASKVDGVLLVVSAGQTRKEMARRAKDLLEKVNARIVGCVLTNAEVETGLQTYYS